MKTTKVTAKVFVALTLWTSVTFAASFELEKGFTKSQEATLQSDLKGLVSLQIESSDPWFRKIFGGASAQNVTAYLDDRINYFIPWTVNIPASVWPAPYFPPPAEVQDASGKVVGALGAYNIGTDLFFVNIKYWDDYTTYYLLGSFGRRLKLESTRVGLIEIGPRYFERLDPADPNRKIPTSRIERMAFLVHEARHSDCSGGLNRSDIEQVRFSRPIQNAQCGYSHVKCPAGHKYENLEACENVSWGAYAVESVFLAAVINSCKNCSAEEIQQAKDLLQDRQSRVLNWNELLAGRAGEPNMTSAGALWN